MEWYVLLLLFSVIAIIVLYVARAMFAPDAQIIYAPTSNDED